MSSLQDLKKNVKPADVPPGTVIVKVFNDNKRSKKKKSNKDSSDSEKRREAARKVMSGARMNDVSQRPFAYGNRQP